MFRSRYRIRAGVNPGKRLEVVDEVRLIKIPAIYRDIGPINISASMDRLQDFLKPSNTAVELWGQTYFRAEYLDKMPCAESDLITQFGYCCHGRHAVKLF